MKLILALLGAVTMGVAIAALLTPKAAAIYASGLFILSGLAVLAVPERKTAGRGDFATTRPAVHR